MNKSAHGVRKIAAQTYAENGATTHELMAIFGWTTVQMAERYTKAAARKKMALRAGHKLNFAQNLISIPAPTHKVRDLARKANVFSHLFFKWCGQEDSNFHGLPH